MKIWIEIEIEKCILITFYCSNPKESDKLEEETKAIELRLQYITWKCNI